MLRFRLIYEFPLSFVKYYLFRLHFTGGWKGFYFALCHAFMRTSRIAKMLESSPEKVKSDATAIPYQTRSKLAKQ
jgi:hypothetical protein